MGLPDGKVIATSGGILARLHRDGSLDRPYDASSPYNEIRALLLLPDGRLIVGGRFDVAGGTTPRTLARFHPDGTEDTTFSATVRHSYFGGTVLSIVRQADGKLLIGGYFDTINGTPCGYFARLNADGSLDTAFASGAGSNGTVQALALGADGRIAIAGEFTTVHGAARDAIARLLPDGSVDPSFTTVGTPNYGVKHVAVQADHRMLVAGSFTTLEGANHPRMARLNEDGTIDPTFNFGAPYAEIRALVLPADGRSIIAGTFTSIGGIRRHGIARLTPTGEVDPTFAHWRQLHHRRRRAAAPHRPVACGRHPRRLLRPRTRIEQRFQRHRHSARWAHPRRWRL